MAQDRYIAKDALDLLRVEYEPLPPLVDPVAAAQDRATPLHAAFGTNVAMRIHVGRGDLQAAFAQADCIVRERYDVPRLAEHPWSVEPWWPLRADRQRLTLWEATQTPHKVKRYVGLLLHQPPREVRVIAPDVGGGFGQKVEIWPEDIALSYLAMRLAQPIKWIEERWENMLAYHGRGYSAEVEAAARRDGTILGMRFRIIADVGAYFLNSSPGPPVNAAHRVAGPYRHSYHGCRVPGRADQQTSHRGPTGAPEDPRAPFSWSAPSTSCPRTRARSSRDPAPQFYPP